MIRINTILAEEMIKSLDIIAKDENKSRSRLLREAVEHYIEEYRKKLVEEKRKNGILHAIDEQNGLRKKAGKWDGVAEIRKWRELHR